MRIISLITVFILLLIGCAVNPKTGQHVLTLGTEMIWDLQITYNHSSSDIASDLVAILVENDYTIESVNKDPLLIRTSQRRIGDPWTEGILPYSLVITSPGVDKFLIKITPYSVVDVGRNVPNPTIVDGIPKPHYDKIVNPLNETFTARGWSILENSSE